LFAYGFGLSVNEQVQLANLNETLDPAVSAHNDNRFLFAGDAVQPWRLVLSDSGGDTQVTSNGQVSAAGSLSIKAADYLAQEDTVEVSWQSKAQLSIQGSPVDLSRQSTADMAMQIDYKVVKLGLGSTQLYLDCEGSNAQLDISEALQQQVSQGWQQAQIKLSCFALSTAQLSHISVPFGLRSDKGTVLQLKDVKLVSNEGQASCAL
jgi:beta-glucosidase